MEYKGDYYGQDVIPKIVFEYKQYVRQNKIDLEYDRSDAVNNFMCSYGYYTEELYDYLMNVEVA